MDQIRNIGSFFAQNVPKVGSFLGKNAGALIPGALTGFGFIDNWLQQRRYNQLQDIARDPRKAAAYFQGLERPLAQGAVAGAENEAQAALGERGLSQSPALSAAVYSQALAPLYQAQQNAAMQAGGNLLGSALYGGAPKPTDVSGPLQELMKRFQPSAADPNADPNIGAPTLPIPGLDPTSVEGISAGAQNLPFTPPDWSGTPDWSSIISGVGSSGSASPFPWSY